MSDPNLNDEFFVGYLNPQPPAYAAKSKLFVLAILITAPMLMILFAVLQQKFNEGTFTFGEFDQFEGTYISEPVPMLLQDGISGGMEAYALVGLFKHGVPEELKGAEGRQVRFAGSLIEKNGQRMIEVNKPETIEILQQQNVPTQPLILTDITLQGEVIDPKCYLGVMKPGFGKTHRGCAIVCLQGGVPPALRVIDEQGNDAVFFLAGPEGKELDLDTQLAATYVEVTGDIQKFGSIAVFRVESLKRI